MPNQNKKCKEKVESPTRTVLESLDICSFHQKIPPCCKAYEQTTSSLSSHCSRKTSELPVQFRTDQTCSSAGCEIPVPPRQSRDNPQLRKENIDCSECNDSNIETKSKCYGCCSAGVQIQTLKEALAELKELRKQTVVSIQEIGQDIVKSTNINIQCFQDNTQNQETMTKIEVPKCREPSDAQEGEGGKETVKHKPMRKQSETNNIPQCCDLEEALNVTIHESSIGARTSSQKHEAKKQKNSYDDTAKVNLGEHKATSTTDTKHNELKQANGRISPTSNDQNSCPSPTSLGNQKETSTTNSKHLSKVGTSSTSDVEMSFFTPVCGLHANETQIPKPRASLNNKESMLPNTNVMASSDDSDDFDVIPCSGQCVQTKDKEKSGPKKCECYFPPAYNQFGCTGNISGNCNCSNIL